MAKILIIDDEAQLAQNLAAYLTSFGDEFQVGTATAGEEGLALLEADPVDVLLTDVRLPGIDGIEVVRRAFEIHPYLQVVVMSGYATPEMRRHALGAGAVKFVEKPIELGELRQILRESAKAGRGWSGRVGGLDIFDLAQLMILNRKSKVIRVRFKKEIGVLTFEGGVLRHASTEELQGEKAFYEMTLWAGGTFEEVPEGSEGKYEPNITHSTVTLLMEAARRKDERNSAKAWSKDGQEALPSEVAEGLVENLDTVFTADPPKPRGGASMEEELLAEIRQPLAELERIEGFQAWALVSCDGKLLECSLKGGSEAPLDWSSANEILQDVQEATDRIGLGAGGFLHVRTSKAILLMRCLGEGMDCPPGEPGQEHVHAIALFAPGSFVGMVLRLLEKAAERAALLRALPRE